MELKKRKYILHESFKNYLGIINTSKCMYWTLVFQIHTVQFGEKIDISSRLMNLKCNNPGNIKM